MSVGLEFEWKIINIIEADIVKIVDELVMRYFMELWTNVLRRTTTRFFQKIVNCVSKDIDCVAYEVNVRLLNLVLSLPRIL